MRRRYIREEGIDGDVRVVARMGTFSYIKLLSSLFLGSGMDDYPRLKDGLYP